MKKMDYSDAAKIMNSIIAKHEKKEPLTKEEANFLFEAWTAYHPAECNFIALLIGTIIAGFIMCFFGYDVKSFLDFAFLIVGIPAITILALTLFDPL